RPIHPELLLQRGHEQGPAVLEVRDGHHAENAEEENQPAVVAKTSHFVRRALHRIRSHDWHPPELRRRTGSVLVSSSTGRPSFPPAQAEPLLPGLVDLWNREHGRDDRCEHQLAIEL